MRVSLLLVLVFIGNQVFGQCSVSLGDDVTQCNGNPITLSAVSNGTASQDSLRITYYAYEGISGLVGSPKVYMHSGVQTVPFGAWEYTTGNWGADDGLGEMTEVATDVWQITIHVPTYYGFPGGTNVNGLWMVFRNADGTATGKDDNDEDIFLYTSNGNTSDFSGVAGTDIAGSAGSYQWSTNETTQSITVNQTGTYSVTFTDGVGCTSTDDIYVEFGSGAIQVDLGPDTSLCDGEIIILDAGAGYASYVWSTSETSQTLEVSLPGDYSVTVTDQSGCTGIDLINISTGVSPTANFSYSAVTGTTVEFTDNGTGATTVYWDFNGDGNIDETTAGGASVQYEFGAETVFGVTMIAENGCGSDTTSQNVLVQDVGIDELKNELGFKVYPIPAKDRITVSLAKSQITGIQILEIRGKLNQNLAGLNSQTHQIELDKLPQGIYVLQVQTPEGTINELILKH